MREHRSLLRAQLAVGGAKASRQERTWLVQGSPEERLKEGKGKRARGHPTTGRTW